MITINVERWLRWKAILDYADALADERKAKAKAARYKKKAIQNSKTWGKRAKEAQIMAEVASDEVARIRAVIDDLGPSRKKKCQT